MNMNDCEISPLCNWNNNNNYCEEICEGTYTDGTYTELTETECITNKHCVFKTGLQKKICNPIPIPNPIPCYNNETQQKCNKNETCLWESMSGGMDGDGIGESGYCIELNSKCNLIIINAVFQLVPVATLMSRLLLP